MKKWYLLIVLWQYLQRNLSQHLKLYIELDVKFNYKFYRED